MTPQALSACCAAALLFGGVISTVQTTREPELRTGDVVFQTSRSAQSTAIQQATGSPYSHVGLIEVTQQGTFVIEAVQPVSRTPWSEWIARGVDSKVLVKRDTALTEEQSQAIVRAARTFVGRPYDATFAWDDKRIYCSELVRKAFERGAGIEVGKMQRLDSLRLGGLGEELRQRFGATLPKERMLVTPESIAQDTRFDVVWTTY